MAKETSQEPKSKKPSSSAFKQQQLKAWQPILTPKSVLPTFFIIGVIFIPLGIGLYITSQNVKEVVVEYTQCDTAGATLTAPDPSSPGVKRWSYDSTTKICTLEFDIPEEMTPPIYLYYRLTNYYQNHRRYVKSFSSKQLQGSAEPASALTDCDPIMTGATWTNDTKPVYPCGLIANSLFNDSFSALLENGEAKIAWDETGIAWPSDKNKFLPTTYAPGDVVPPPNWVKYNNSYTSDNLFNPHEDEHFMVWMRTAGLSTFRKLWGRSPDVVLPAGTYQLNVLMQYPVKEFGGTKGVVISTTSWLGGKNPFLGIAYMTVGAICLVLCFGFLIRHVYKPRKLGDENYLSWKQNKQH